MENLQVRETFRFLYHYFDFVEDFLKRMIKTILLAFKNSSFCMKDSILKI